MLRRGDDSGLVAADVFILVLAAVLGVSRAALAEFRGELTSTASAAGLSESAVGTRCGEDIGVSSSDGMAVLATPPGDSAKASGESTSFAAGGSAETSIFGVLLLSEASMATRGVGRRPMSCC